MEIITNHFGDEKLRIRKVYNEPKIMELRREQKSSNPDMSNSTISTPKYQALQKIQVKNICKHL